MMMNHGSIGAIPIGSCFDLQRSGLMRLLNPKKVESIHPDVLETGTVWHPIFSKDVQGQLWWYNMV